MYVSKIRPYKGQLEKKVGGDNGFIQLSNKDNTVGDPIGLLAWS